MKARSRSWVLVTGGCGFVGSHLVSALLAAGHRVVCYDLLTYAASLDLLAPAMRRWKHAVVDRVWNPALLRDRSLRLVVVRGDLNDAAMLTSILAGCRGVFALAAETHVDYSYHTPGVFMRANVNGTQNLLDAWRLAGGGGRLLHVSTDEVYGQVAAGVVDEEAPLRPRNLYAVSKAAGDLLAQTYARVFGLDVVVVRPCNIYGPGQQPKDLIPKTFSHFLEGKRMPIHGDGRHVREYLFVEDAVRGLMELFERGAAGECYNLASGDFHSTLEVVQAVAAQLDLDWRSRVTFTADRPHADRRYAGDTAKARRVLGRRWRLTPFAEGLARMKEDFLRRRPAPLL